MGASTIPPADPRPQGGPFGPSIACVGRRRILVETYEGRTLLLHIYQRDKRLATLQLETNDAEALVDQIDMALGQIERKPGLFSRLLARVKSKPAPKA